MNATEEISMIHNHDTMIDETPQEPMETTDGFEIETSTTDVAPDLSTETGEDSLKKVPETEDSVVGEGIEEPADDGDEQVGSLEAEATTSDTTTDLEEDPTAVSTAEESLVEVVEPVPLEVATPDDNEQRLDATKPSEPVAVTAGAKPEPPAPQAPKPEAPKPVVKETANKSIATGHHEMAKENGSATVSYVNSSQSSQVVEKPAASFQAKVPRVSNENSIVARMRAKFEKAS